MVGRLAGLTLAMALAAGAWAASPEAAVVADGLGFPEGTILADKTLYFVDYQASTVNRLDGNAYTVVARLPGCGANGLAAVNGGLWVACYDAGVVVKISTTGERLATVYRSPKGERFSRPNDLVANHDGDVYFTASGDAPGDGKVFLLPRSGSAPREIAQGLNNANGIALSPDGKTLYVGESGADRILTYQVNGDGTLRDQRVFADLDSLAPPASGGRHTPDGVRVGSDGLIYVALYNGGGYWVLDEKGALLKAADVPGEHHSNLALAADGHAIYVTSLSGASGRIYRLALPRAEHDASASIK